MCSNINISLESYTWSLINASGQVPSARDKASASVIGEDIFLFGGFGPKAIDEVLVYNFQIILHSSVFRTRVCPKTIPQDDDVKNL